MKLYIKQKVFSIGEKFTVRDEMGTDRYRVEGEFFSIPKRFHIYDTNGREVCTIEKKLFSFLPRYYVYKENSLAAEIVKKFTFFIPKYDILGTPYAVEGGFMSHNYAITRDGIPIADIHKEWFTWGDSYAIDINSSADEILMLAILITIDCELDGEAAAVNNN